MANPVNPIDMEHTPQAISKHNEEKKQEQANGPEPLLIAYMLLFDSVQIDHEAASIEAKGVQANAMAQSNLIKEQAIYNFETVSQSQIDNVKKSKQNVFLEKLNTANQEISAVRGNLGNLINVLKQSVQVSETKINTTMNIDQQSISQGSSLMNMLTSLTNQVSRI